MNVRYPWLLFLLLQTIVSLGQDVDSVALEQERTRWNKSLTRDTAYRFNKEPNALLMEVIKKKKPGKALDVGMGQGRNTIYLAQQGWDVTGFDIADEAVAFAKDRAAKLKVKIKTVLAPIETFDFGIAKWDLINYVYEGCVDDGEIERIRKSLKPGGLIVFEFFHRDAGIRMKRPDFGCETNVIRNAVEKAGGFKILRYEEADGIADYGLRTLKLVKMVAERK